MRPLAVGLNCALGAAEMRPYLAELSRAGRPAAPPRQYARRSRYARRGRPDRAPPHHDPPAQPARRLHLRANRTVRGMEPVGQPGFFGPGKPFEIRELEARIEQLLRVIAVVPQPDFVG